MLEKLFIKGARKLINKLGDLTEEETELIWRYGKQSGDIAVLMKAQTPDEVLAHIKLVNNFQPSKDED